MLKKNGSAVVELSRAAAAALLLAFGCSVPAFALAGPAGDGSQIAKRCDAVLVREFGADAVAATPVLYTPASGPASRQAEVEGKKWCWEFSPLPRNGSEKVDGDDEDTCAEAKRSAHDLCYRENRTVCSGGGCMLKGDSFSKDPCL